MEGQGRPTPTSFPWEIHRLLQAGTWLGPALLQMDITEGKEKKEFIYITQESTPHKAPHGLKSARRGSVFFIVYFQ